MGEKRLLTSSIEQAMTAKGLNAADLAGQLEVSRTIVSEWLRGKKHPRPKHLLALGKILHLSYDQLVLRDYAAEPIVAYRKHGNAKLRSEDTLRAKSMGRALEFLVPYLPFGKLDAPARFIAPRNSSPYIEEAAEETRRAAKPQCGRLQIADIITLFSQLKAVLIPVLWGEKDRLDNALHLFLPNSQTTVIYLNLDVAFLDFKFWMLHELAHAKTFSLMEEQEAEKFADAFAAAVLVPRSLAESEYRRMQALPDAAAKISAAVALAESLEISPITVARRINGIAEENKEGAVIGKSIYSAATNIRKKYPLVSAGIFRTTHPEAKKFIELSETYFGTPIYKALRAYIADHGGSEGVVSAVLGIPPADAKAVLDALGPD